MEKQKDVFKILSAVDCKNFTASRNGLSYLTWSKAWEQVSNIYPDATYKIVKNENGLPYFIDESGAMVYTEVTIGGITREMWLPVMNNLNKAMKKEQYEYTTRNGKKIVEAITMFEVNKSVMRCLTKNLAMFGLGLYIYNGEDLPEQSTHLTEDQVEVLEKLIEDTRSNKEKLLKFFRVNNIHEVDFNTCKAMLDKKTKESGATDGK